MKRPILTSPHAVRGVSLIELMTAMTIGLLILIGLTSVFVNSSTSNRELKNTAEQIENGRYAIELLGQDIRHAGFYGELSTLPTVPAAAPDPCTAPTAGAVSDTVNAALALPVQRAVAGTDCTALLTALNLQANSDIVVVRRTDTTRLPIGCSSSVTLKGTPTTADPFPAGYIYLQTTPNAAEIQTGGADGTVIDSTKNATGAAYTAAMFRRDQTVAAGATAGTCAPAVAGQFPLAAAAIRKYRTHIYFVAPCSVPAGGGTLCTGASDDGGRPIPTLKRLEMGAGGAFTIVPIVEGIQAIRVEYGLDTLPAVADVNTGLIGDGVTDSYTNTPSVAQMGDTIAVRLYVLARNTMPTNGYTDDKTYTLGANPVYTYTPTGVVQTSYKRHVYSTEMRIVNQAGRREIPR
jgi:type IV pilus assembly protein PilW